MLRCRCKLVTLICAYHLKVATATASCQAPAKGRSSLPEQREQNLTSLFPSIHIHAGVGDDAKTSEGARGRSSCCAHLVRVPVRSDLVFPAAAALCARQLVCLSFLTWLQRSENSCQGFSAFSDLCDRGDDNDSDKDKRGGCLLLDMIE
jgi:hypothetical protein